MAEPAVYSGFMAPEEGEEGKPVDTHGHREEVNSKTILESKELPRGNHTAKPDTCEKENYDDLRHILK